MGEQEDGCFRRRWLLGVPAVPPPEGALLHEVGAFLGTFAGELGAAAFPGVVPDRALGFQTLAQFEAALLRSVGGLNFFSSRFGPNFASNLHHGLPRTHYCREQMC